MRRALAFLTVIGGSASPSEDTLWWFPLTGALIGLVVGAVWWLAARAWSPLVAATVAVAADAAVTGLLHLDGLADSADGLIAPMDRARRLAVMADPTVGAFGVITVVVVLLVRTAALGSLVAAPLLLAGLWCGSRTAMAVLARILPYARGEGLATAFLGRSTPPVAVAALGVGGLIAAAALAWLGGSHLPHRWLAPLAVLAGAATAAGVATLARRRLGGFTGDVLGAAGVLSETVGLLVLAVRR